MVNIYCNKSYLFTYLLNINTDIVIFHQYHIEVEKVISKHHYLKLSEC